jgi:hypothetical protein
MDQLDAVIAAKDFQTRVLDTQADLKSAYAHLERLGEALSNAGERGFSHTKEVQQCRVFSEVVSNLRAAIALSDEKSLGDELVKFEALGLAENHLTLEARRVKAQLADTEHYANETFASVSAGKEQDGVSDSDYMRLKALLSKVDHRLEGLPDVEAVTRSREQVATIEDERKVIGSLQDALRYGGWLNAGAQSGEFSTYQSGSSIDSSVLEGLLQQQGDFITENGRWLARWCSAVVSLRRAVRVALEAPSPEHWRAVDNVVEETVPAVMDQKKGKSAVTPIGYEEVTAAKLEVQYRKRCQDSLVALAKTLVDITAESDLDERSEYLRRAVRVCLDLQLGEDTAVVAAQATLQSLDQMLAACRGALSSLEVTDLAAAIQLCAEHKTESSEQENCVKVHRALVALSDALERKNVADVCHTISVVSDCDALRSSVGTAGRAFVEETQQLVFSTGSTLQAVKTAADNAGVTQAQYDQLVQLASSAAGLTGVLGMEDVVATVAVLEAEFERLGALKRAIAEGGFLNDGVSLGDY